jgi:hypothetical protein
MILLKKGAEVSFYAKRSPRQDSPTGKKDAGDQRRLKTRLANDDSNA